MALLLYLGQTILEFTFVQQQLIYVYGEYLHGRIHLDIFKTS